MAFTEQEYEELWLKSDDEPLDPKTMKPYLPEELIKDESESSNDEKN